MFEVPNLNRSVLTSDGSSMPSVCSSFRQRFDESEGLIRQMAKSVNIQTTCVLTGGSCAMKNAGLRPAFLFVKDT